jgi:predicted nucleic acid-binding protein
VIYSALHKPSGVCGRIVTLSAEALIELYSIDLAREELRANLERKMHTNKDEIELIIQGLPVQWIPREAYAHHLKTAIPIVGNQPDAAFLAASIATGIPLVTGDRDLQSQHVRRLAQTFAPRDFANIIREEKRKLDRRNRGRLRQHE